MKNPFISHRLGNGLEVVIEVMPDVSSAAAGFFVRAGGRDERPAEAGISHFLEHMMFKGTARRSWRQITVDFDDLGSTYNAYTTKDRTFYYGWVPCRHIAAQIEILADMMRSTLPAEEFEMERNVILEEIAMSADSIDNRAYDHMHEQIFPDHPLAWPVLGYDRTVRDMTRELMVEYFAARYAPDNVVLIVAGRVDPDAIVQQAETLCGGWPVSASPGGRQPPQFQPGASCKVLERFNQQVMAAVFPTCGGADPLNETADVLASILGGDNSPFYWNIVQKGIAPQAGVWRVDYAECGLTMLSGECDPDGCEQLYEAMHLEAEKIKRDGASEAAVQRVRNRRRMTLAIESEAPYYRLNQILDDIDYRQRPLTVAERLAEVDAVTPKKIAEYLERYPITEAGHFISVGPREWLPN